MKSPPKKLADQTVRAYARYRDADLHYLPTARQAVFFDRAQALFKKLVRSMECSSNEEWMVSQNISHMVSQMTPSKRPPR